MPSGSAGRTHRRGPCESAADDGGDVLQQQRTQRGARGGPRRGPSAGFNSSTRRTMCRYSPDSWCSNQTIANGGRAMAWFESRTAAQRAKALTRVSPLRSEKINGRGARESAHKQVHRVSVRVRPQPCGVEGRRVRSSYARLRPDDRLRPDTPAPAAGGDGRPPASRSAR